MLGGREPMDCRRTLKAVHGAFYGGLGALAVNLMVLSVVPADQTWLPVLTIVLCALGIAGIIGGIVLGYVRLRCPRCGASLMLGGRIPSHLPNFCPACGEPL